MCFVVRVHEHKNKICHVSVIASHPVAQDVFIVRANDLTHFISSARLTISLAKKFALITQHITQDPHIFDCCEMAINTFILYGAGCCLRCLV